jgi:hypothetical protein
MSDFIEVGTVSKKTLIRTITFSCVGKIDRKKLEQFRKELMALLAAYGLKCVAAKPGGGYGSGKASKRPSASKGRARKTASR